MTLWAIFMGIAAIFGIVLLIAVVFDGVLDVFDVGGDGVLSLTSIGGAGVGFGAAGALAIGIADVELGGAIIAGLVGAGLMGYGAMKISSAFQKLEHQSVDPESKVGRVGHALTGAKAGETFEFSLLHAGVREKKYASAPVDVKSGDQLEVEAILSPSRVKVKPLAGPEEVESLTEDQKIEQSIRKQIEE